MKQIFLLLLLVPFFGTAQNKTQEFTISGTVTGYENGTSVSFLNDQTGQPEKQTTIENGKFTIKGSVPAPMFKVLVFGDQPPVIPIFVENTKITVSGDKARADQMVVAGSKTHAEYVEYMSSLQPHIPVFQNPAARTPEALSAIETVAEAFIKKHPGSYVSPIVLIQLLELQNVPKAEELFALLSKDVRESEMAKYVEAQISDSKLNAVGSIMPDFAQADTSGNMVKLSSLRGKYVLVDFWASWCMPCRQENPNIVANFKKYESKNFTVLGVSLDQAKPAWLNAIKMDNLHWTQVSDLKGWQNEVATQFRIYQIPKSFLLDPQGKIIAKDLRGEALGRKLKELFGE